VTERGRPDLAEQARKRAISLRADVYGVQTVVERECLEAALAYETALTASKGRSMRASTFWRMSERFGVMGAVERAVDRQTEVPYHGVLMAMGLRDYAFEAIVARHPEVFGKAAVRRASRCVDEWKRAANGAASGSKLSAKNG
jgi:hypothetical protein